MNIIGTFVFFEEEEEEEEKEEENDGRLENKISVTPKGKLGYVGVGVCVCIVEHHHKHHTHTKRWIMGNGREKPIGSSIRGCSQERAFIALDLRTHYLDF